jgi:hypothetical protein
VLPVSILSAIRQRLTRRTTEPGQPPLPYVTGWHSCSLGLTPPAPPVS